MKQLLTTFLIAAGLGGAALAQDVAQEPAEKGALPEFAAVDRNQDGKIDQAEAEVLAEVLKESDTEFDFQTADANEDGAIDAAEYAQYQEELKA
ncbi:MAG TPA: dockerin type I domain-containing protein [Gammaproteobacteria bacterium]|nr:dockerin type I domain-containing protein [Gammaproteobacteria bacterium]